MRMMSIFSTSLTKMAKTKIREVFMLCSAKTCTNCKWRRISCNSFVRLMHQIASNGQAVIGSDGMGNAMNDIIYQYVRIVVTNLKTHRKKRLREFLRMKAYKSDVPNTKKNINHAIAYMVGGPDTLANVNDELARSRRSYVARINASNCGNRQRGK